ncbi:unnamed protein product [Mycena citricolor]|uniref:NADH:flavin oxidoreductase/NADH oxidase N-terminal domain-containing protein n=1 Tax=Mycena citricolor TaxID=2018698 RepID=A0AAD2HZY2_9AGAR|nr:unnamed protein product [Mycena citricolor]CAK5283743.1 unnamed protein product [Mycena citricolor]
MASGTTSSTTPKLFTPVTLGSVTMPNRIFMAPMARNRSSDTVPNDIMREYYVRRVRGGAGLIVTEASLVSRQGTEWQDSPGIWNTEQMEGWKKIVDAVHEEGGRIFCQIMHTGRASHPDAPHQIASGEPVWAPSAVRAAGGKFRFIPGVPGYAMPTEIPDPWKMVELFRIAALHAKEAGFDGVEVHGASGYLITQFLDPSVNKRTDEWGGSPENRARFPLEILKAVRKIWGPNVGFKINPAGGYNDVGFPLEETITSFGYLLSEVDKLGLAYVCILRYLDLFDPAKRGTPHDVWEIYAPYLKNTPLIPNGGITPEQALEWVESGKFPAVSIGIPWMSHPDLGRRIRAGKPLDNKLDGPHVYGGAFEPSIGYLDYPEATYD